MLACAAVGRSRELRQLKGPILIRLESWDLPIESQCNFLRPCRIPLPTPGWLSNSLSTSRYCSWFGYLSLENSPLQVWLSGRRCSRYDNMWQLAVIHRGFSLAQPVIKLATLEVAEMAMESWDYGMVQPPAQIMLKSTSQPSIMIYPPSIWIYHHCSSYFIVFTPIFLCVSCALPPNLPRQTYRDLCVWDQGLQGTMGTWSLELSEFSNQMMKIAGFLPGCWLLSTCSLVKGVPFFCFIYFWGQKNSKVTMKLVGWFNHRILSQQKWCFQAFLYGFYMVLYGCYWLQS